MLKFWRRARCRRRGQQLLLKVIVRALLNPEIGAAARARARLRALRHVVAPHLSQRHAPCHRLRLKLRVAHVSHQRGRQLAALAEEEHEQLLVHAVLHLHGVQVVGVVAEWILQLRGNGIQAPEDEDHEEAEEGGQEHVRRPGADHHGRDDQVAHQEDQRRLGVGKGEGQDADLHAVVEHHHAVSELVESASEDRRWDVEDSLVNAGHHNALDPLEDELDLVLGLPERPAGLLVQALPIYDLKLVQPIVHGLDVALVSALQLCHGEGGEDAEQAQEEVLEALDHIGFRL
mmetsp:Transcript_36054/g.100023  ORF Transcript_36054/g.100023 Transcript_36054/m.100023 type:complete len:289 (+) Transcript_36054:51-917(+)